MADDSMVVVCWLMLLQPGSLPWDAKFNSSYDPVDNDIVHMNTAPA